MAKSSKSIRLISSFTSLPEQGIPRREAAPVTAPHNIEAEQALLGAVLVENAVLDNVSGFLEANHFYDPLHGRVYAVMLARFQSGQLSAPTTLKGTFENDEAMAERGGGAYLVNLSNAAISLVAAPDYARLICELALRRALGSLGDEIAYKAKRQDDPLSPRDQIVEAERALYDLSESGARGRSGFISFGSAAGNALELVSRAYHRDGHLAGVSSGLADLDRLLGGFHPSDLIIIAGRPSMGKTALATNIAFEIARAFRRGERAENATDPVRGGDATEKERAIEGGVVGFFSLEMSSEQLALRILAEQSQIPSEKLRRGDLEESQFHTFAQCSRLLEDLPLHIDDSPALSIASISARARRLKRQHGLDVLIVDYLQLARPASHLDYGRVHEVSEITQGLKAIAKELDIPVIALSQLSRAVEHRDDRRPQLADLRESGSIEQDADVVMFVFREEYYLARKEPAEGTPEHFEWQEKMETVHNLAEIIIGKQRHGPIGTVKLMFDKRYTRFSDLAAAEKVPQRNG